MMWYVAYVNHARRDVTSGKEWAFVAGVSAILGLLAFSFFSSPVSFETDGSSIWAANRIGQVTSYTMPWRNVNRVYVQEIAGSRLSSSFQQLVVVSVSGSKIVVGQVSDLGYIKQRRDQLTQFLAARGVKVSNDPPPAKP